jgi:hypothetical protein
MPIRIVDVREATKPIASPIRNAYIDFSKMTISLVAVVTDVVRDGRRSSATVSIRTAATGRADSSASASLRGCSRPIRARSSMRPAITSMPIARGRQ